MSLGVVRQVRVPKFTRENVSLLAATVRGLRDGCSFSAARVEVAVARAYGIGRDTMAMLVDSFEKIDDAEKRRLLDSSLWTGAGHSEYDREPSVSEAQ